MSNVECMVGLARLLEEPSRGIKSLRVGVQQVLGELSRNAAAIVPIIAGMLPPVVGSCYCRTEKATTLIA
jgi:hypothetical protein